MKTQQLSHLEEGEDNSELEPKNSIKKIQNSNTLILSKQNTVLGLLETFCPSMASFMG